MTSTVEQLLKSKRTLIDVLGNHLGYDTKEHETITRELINQQYLNGQLDMIIPHTKKNTKVFIKYLFNPATENSKFSVKNIAEIVDTILLHPNEEEAFTQKDTLIIIASGEAVANHNSENICKTLNTLYMDKGYFVVLFNIKYLQVNILKHERQDEYTIIEEEDVPDVLGKLNASLEQLPEQSRYDTLSKILLLRPKQILQCKSPSITAGFLMKYYVCVE
jgi:DNA-directed RNA polymerase subunit H (RpoH/RPB5)